MTVLARRSLTLLSLLLLSASAFAGTTTIDWSVHHEESTGTLTPFTFVAQVLLSANDATAITLAVPSAGAPVNLQYSPVNNRWEVLIGAASESELLQNYPDGAYVFTVTRAGGPETLNATLGGTFPPVPNITQPTPNSFVDESAPLAVNWDAWVNPPASNGTILFSYDMYGNSRGNAGHVVGDTSHTIAANTLGANGRYGFSISFLAGTGDHGFKIQTKRIEVNTTGYQVVLTKTKEPNGSITAEFYAHLDFANIASATLTVQATSETLTMSNDFNDDQIWRLNVRADDVASLLARFPDGNYVFNFNLNGGGSDSRTAVLGGSFPTVFPNITSPANNSIVAPTTPLNITWDQWLPANVQESFISGTTGQSYAWSVDENLTSYLIPANQVPLNTDMRLDVVFVNTSGQVSGQWTGAKWTRSLVNVATGKAVTDYVLELAHVNAAPPFGPGGKLHLELSGSGIKSGTLVTPASETIPLQISEDDGPGVKIENVPLAAFDTRFTDGTYTLNVVFLDNTTQSIAISMNGSYPPQATLSAPAPDSVINPAQLLQISWNQWQQSSDPNSNELLQIKPDEGDGDFEDSLDVTATGYSVPANTLQLNNAYMIVIRFQTQINTHAVKSSGSELRVFTGPRGFITLHSNPEGAELFEGHGSSIGVVTPFGPYALPVGSYDQENFGITLKKAGFRDFVIPAFTITADQTTTYTANLVSTGSNHAPAFVSTPTASPNPALTGVSVTFSVNVTDADGDEISVTWDFGDNSFGVGSPATHAYTAAGIYNATVTISDGIVSVTRTINVAVNVSPTGGEANEFTVQKAAIKFNFAKPNGDALTFLGTLPVDIEETLVGVEVTVATGDLESSFTLDAKGKAATATTSFKLAAKLSKGSIAATPAKYTYGVKKLTLFPLLEDLGFVNADVGKGVTVDDIPVVMSIGEDSYLDFLTVSYTAKKNKNGTGKK